MDHEAGILNEVLRPQLVPNWLLVWSLIILVAYIIIRLFYPKYWARFRQSLIYSMEAERLLKEKNINLLQFGFLLNTLSSLSIALFLYIALPQIGVRWPGSGPGDLVVFSIGFLILTGLRYFLLDILGRLLKSNALASRINHVSLLHLKFFGFYMIFFALMLSFFPDQIKIFALVGGFLVIGIMLFLNYLRGMEILLQERISILYGILYLCTLEIAPILVIVNVVVV